MRAAPVLRLPALPAALVSGVLYGLCFPTPSLRALAWIALVPFLLAVRGAGRAGAAALALAWTVVAAATLGHWFPGTLASYYGQPLIVGFGFFFGVSALMAAPYYVAFALWYRVVARAAPRGLPLLAAAAWVAAEAARARWVGGNPWGLFGYSQIGRDALVQIADATGPYGVSFLLVAVNAAIADVIAERRARLARLAPVAALLLVVPAYGAMRLTTLPPASGPPVSVGLVQGNVDVGAQWDEAMYGRNLDVYLGLTAELTRDDPPALIVWPENGLTFFLEDEPAYRAAIARVLAPAGVELLAGGPRAADLPAGRAFFNSMFLLGADGAIRGRYDKQRLVPFGERFPLPHVAALARRFRRVRELSPGQFDDPVATVAGSAGIVICSEAMFPEIAARRVSDGATFLVDPAHDTWVTPSFSAQQFDIVRLRAVEQRRWIARASTSGPSAIVDPRGRVVTRSDFSTRAAVRGTIEPRSDRTIYQRVGDLFAVACAVAAVGALMPAASAAVRRTARG